jgi:hypothetical protein
LVFFPENSEKTANRTTAEQRDNSGHNSEKTAGAAAPALCAGERAGGIAREGMAPDIWVQSATVKEQNKNFFGVRIHKRTGESD